MMDALGENHDLALKEVKTRIENEMEALSEAQAQHTRSGTCTEDPSAFLSTCETCQNIKASKCKSQHGFTIAFDNIDVHLERREMTMSAQNRDIHWVNHEMVQNRVSGNTLDSQHPKAHLADVPNITFLPNVYDQHRQRLNYVILVSRILVSYFDCFAPFKDVCIYHIPHKYSKEQSKKSVKVLRKIIFWILSQLTLTA